MDDVRVEKLIPEVKVKYMPGVDKARWLSIHCEECYPARGETIEYSYEIETPIFNEIRLSHMDCFVTDRLCPDHQTFIGHCLKRVVRDTTWRFVSDVVERRGEGIGRDGFDDLKNSELWVIVEPKHEMTEDDVW